MFGMLSQSWVLLAHAFNPSPRLGAEPSTAKAASTSPSDIVLKTHTVEISNLIQASGHATDF